MSPVNARDVLLFKISNYLTSTLAFFLPALSSLLFSVCLQLTKQFMANKVNAEAAQSLRKINFLISLLHSFQNLR